MKEGLTEIVCILDRSGSMGSLQEETITKFNAFVEEQKDVPGDALVTVVLFDDQYDVLHASLPLPELPKLTSKDYFARGWTALNDALGKTIAEVGGRLDGMAEEDRPEKVIFMIITDGLENKSQEFPGEDGRLKVKAMVDHQREKFSWEFMFLGAKMDAVQVGGGYGVQVNMCASFGHSGKGVSSAYSASGKRLRAMRCMPSEDYKGLHALDQDTEK